MNKAELLLEVHLKDSGIPFAREVKLTARRFRWDFVVDTLAIEIQGGIYSRGRHTRGAGYAKDCEKMRLAITHGYIPVYFTTQEVMDGTAIAWLTQYRQASDLSVPSLTSS